MSNFSLSVLIEINGVMTKVGSITGTDYKDAVFAYDDSYIADSMHSDPDDYVSILKELGQECLGAIQIVDESVQSVEADFRELSKKEVKALAEEGASLAANLVIESHLSLTGASGKTGLYYDEKKKKWFQPVGSAPSNYIVKQCHVRLSNIVVNEQLCLLTAKTLGIEIPESFIIQTGKNKTEDADILFATKRYDRHVDLGFTKNPKNGDVKALSEACLDATYEVSKELNSLPVPYRLHQEDFAQALGINSLQKYEKNGGIT